MKREKLRRCFKYVKTEVSSLREIKKGDLYSLEPVDAEDNWQEPDTILLADSDARQIEGGPEGQSVVIAFKLIKSIDGIFPGE